jgi:copper ion binding protein
MKLKGALMNRTLKITGMSCEHCVNAVKAALEQVPGVTNVNVVLDQGTASLQTSQDSVSDTALSEAVQNAGYEVESFPSTKQ